MPASGTRRLRSTSTASALSGETYTTRHRLSREGAGSNISRFRHHRNAARVLPVPVGARISVDSARAIAGQPSCCGRVGAGNVVENQERTAGSNRSSTSSATILIVVGRFHRPGKRAGQPIRIIKIMGDAGEGLVDAE